MIDDKLLKDYRQFSDEVMQCDAYLLAGDEERAYGLTGVTAGTAQWGLHRRIGLAIDGTKRKTNNEHDKPWTQIGISRATYYRDQARSKRNEQIR